ncbi:MAG: diguanylate cyclase [Verrucomicrobiae bacterium]|nr:diguanylate cyclase [Verrucomicrobiae bacterium]
MIFDAKGFFGKFDVYRVFFVSVCLSILLCFAGVCLGVMLRTQTMIKEEILAQARSHFVSIVLTRKWNASYGGVFVEKTEGVKSNPYLINPDFTAADGKVYTKKNPALMTREISEYAAKEGLFNFHITSLKPLNPGNKADAFEEAALRDFETKGIKEAHVSERKGEDHFFRYIAPLYVEKSCLKCHQIQGYKLGDVRGGISVSFNINCLESQIRLQTVFIVAATILIVVMLLAFIYYCFNNLRRQLSEANEQLRLAAITDGLTGLFNRRHTFALVEDEFEKARSGGLILGCLMMDVDRFKFINDTFGHLSGDAVLRQIAGVLRGAVPAGALVGRYGGEEFLMMLPGMNLAESKRVAEWIRDGIERQVARGAAVPGLERVTISIGVAVFRGEDDGMEALLKRADEALYRAKKRGRNRVEEEVGARECFSLVDTGR